MFNSIRSRINITLVLMAIVPLIILSVVFAWRGLNSTQQQALRFQKETAQRVAIQLEAFITSLERELQIVEQTHGLSTLEPEQQQAVLSQLLSQQTAFDELTLLSASGQERVRLNRFRTITTAQLESRAQLDEFTVPANSGQNYYSSVHFAAETGEPLITIALPLRDLRTAEINNILVADVRFKHIWDLLAALPLEQEVAYIVDSNDFVVAHQNPSVVLRGTSFSLPQDDGVMIGLSEEDVILASSQVTLGGQQFTVVIERSFAAVLAPAYYVIFGALGLIAVLVIIALAISGLITNTIAGPLQELTTTAQRIEAGDLAARAKTTGLLEVQILAGALNNMTEQLEQTLRLLEIRVLERTRALEVSAQVSRSLSTILDSDQLVKTVVEQVKASFDYYHAHIYLLDKEETTLHMVGGTGRAGQIMLEQNHKIASGKGLVGRAAATNNTVLVSNVANEPDWLPNPLLPDTQAEIAVPISLGEQVLGVLDVQHNILNGLSEQDANLLEAVANQVAIALRNAHQYQMAQARAERQELINQINQKIQMTDNMEQALQTAVRELGQAVGAAHTRARLHRIQTTNGNNDATEG